MYSPSSSIEEFNQNFDFIQYAIDNYGGRNTSSCVMISCPFHAEETASCAIYPHSYYCFGAGCHAHGTAMDFITKTTGLSVNEVLNGKEFEAVYEGQPKRQKSNKKVSVPRKSKLNRYNERLINRPDKLLFLLKRHFTEQTVKDANIGYVEKPDMFSRFTAPRYSIPVYDENGKLVTARYRIDPEYDDGTEPKYLAHPKSIVSLYNKHILDKYQDIVIVGSELDAAFLYYRYGILAVAPPGEGNFKQEWATDFYDKNVLIWLDYDFAGVNASIKIHNMIKVVGRSRIYKWDSDFNNKDDICDFVTRYSATEVIKVLKRYDVKAYL